MTDRMERRTVDHSTGTAYYTAVVICKNDGTEETALLPGMHAPGRLDPQEPADAQIIAEALNVIDNLRIACESLDSEFVRQLADDLRQCEGLTQAVAGYAIRELIDLYAQKLKLAAEEQGIAAIARASHIHETRGGDGSAGLQVDLTEISVERTIAGVESIVRQSMDEGNLWPGLAEWTMTQVLAWTAEELEDECGHEQLASLSYEEFDNVWRSKLFADGNIEDKATEALHHYAQEFTDLFIDGARGLPSSTLGKLLGLMGTRRGRPPETPTGYDRETWLLLARELQQRRNEHATWAELAELAGVEDIETPKRLLKWLARHDGKYTKL